MAKKTLLLLSGLLVFVGGIVHYYLNNNYYQEEQVLPVLWERFLIEEGADNISENTRGIIVPHHLITATELTKFYRGLAQKYSPRRVFLFSPNHFESGEASVQTSKKYYQSYDQVVLKTDITLINKLVENSLVTINNDTFTNEHGILSHINYIKHFWSETKIVPIVLKWQTSKEELDSLIDFLKQEIDLETDLVIASVDFSHYNSHLVADLHDQTSQATISNGWSFEDLHSLDIDSPASVYVLSQLLEENNYSKIELVKQTNSQQWFKPDSTEITTSHLFFTFSKGEKEEIKQTSFHFFGDTIFDRGVSKYLKKNAEAGKYSSTDLNNNHYLLFANIERIEKRFFLGNDFNVLNLEGPINQNGAVQDREVTFNQDSQTIDILKNYWFNAINLANNHIYDYFPAGADNTRKTLAEAEIESFGDFMVGENSCYLVEKNNVKTALCGFNATGKLLSKTETTRILQEWQQKSDFIIANVHWGDEYKIVQNDYQIKTAQFLIDNGVDLIIGHHPHVVQPLDFYKGKPIFYSLGNFVFDQTEPKETKMGLSIGVVVKKEGAEKEMLLYLVPFDTGSGQPVNFNNQERINFLEEFIGEYKNYQTDILGNLLIKLENE